ncbi:MAG: hypothetical protein WC959_01535 [Kiritimatiellales bacterium]
MQNRKNKNTLSNITILIIGIMIMGGALSAATVANFTEGFGTSSWDQYTGKAGGGWQSAWVISGEGLFGQIVSSSELDRGGNYLNGSMNVKEGVKEAFFAREWDTSALKETGIVKISWKWRMDSRSFGHGDRICFQEGTSSRSTFNIFAYGTPVNNTAPRQFMFFDGDKKGNFDNSQMVDSGMTMIPGTVYTFTVTLNQRTKTWTAAISDGKKTVESQPLGFRSGRDISGELRIGMQAKAKIINFSVDAISID